MGAYARSPPLSGRDASALTVMRRPSWSSRSSNFDYALPNLVRRLSLYQQKESVSKALDDSCVDKFYPMVQQVGYSVSPMGGQDSLESSLLGRSNPSHRIHISMPAHTLASDAAGAQTYHSWRVCEI